MSGSAKKRVLVVDDAVVVRKVLSDAIARDPDLEVAATASNGRIALMQFKAARPDIVLLDIEMPEMDGLTTVRELRKLDSRVPIVMFSTLTERAALATLEALALGATDYVTKPSNSASSSTLDAISHELIPKIRGLCRLREHAGPESRLAVRVPRAAANHHGGAPPVHIVAIGVSTGGPDALAKVIPQLPANLPVPVVIAQHMPPVFTTALAARLSAMSYLPVRECTTGVRLVPGCAFLAPGNFHMIANTVRGQQVLQLNKDPKENFCRPSVDVLFRSVANVYGPNALAVVLTGMGHDGVKGCEALQESGARIYVQDEASSVVWGMPGLVAKAGLADKILPLDQIGFEIIRAAKSQLAARV